MLNCLKLKNYIFIDDLEIDFSEGLTILTGETGSGKSILVDAISLLLGEKVEKQIIKKDADFCEISVIFDIKARLFDTQNFENESIDKEIFEEFLTNLNEEKTLIFTRRILKNNKNKFYINGKFVILNVMKEILSRFLEIHGQNSNQKIFSNSIQLNILDRFSNNQKILKEIEKFYNLKNQIEKKLSDILEEKKVLKEKKDFLKFQADELSKFNFKKGEDEELEIEYKKLSNIDLIGQILNNISEKSAIISQNIFNLAKNFEELKKYNNDYLEFDNEINSSMDMFNELENRINSSKNLLESSPYRLDEIAAKLDKISKMKKKYHLRLDELLEYKSKLETDLKKIDYDSDEEIELKDELIEINKKLDEKSQEIHKIRFENAKNLEILINKNFEELDMEKVQLKIEITKNQNFSTNDLIFSKTGFDKVNFLIKTNPGQDFAELKNIISGGELSRIMLAIKYVLSNFDKTTTLIFDEIDTGISGKTAFIIGKKMKNIAMSHQVFCITHQPQVAVFGDNNKLIKKEISANDIKIKVENLSKTGKIKEIARMLGGLNITEKVIENAKELIESAEKI
ncbi:MAG: DNA repair protein RecN [Elusimicrobiota bacterium]|jgi:DNA repair protein RecN (Recombination protein N)|nr:DNA repair protein RecN [Elusimicrobiota bacterium]